MSWSGSLRCLLCESNVLGKKLVKLPCKGRSGKGAYLVLVFYFSLPLLSNCRPRSSGQKYDMLVRMRVLAECASEPFGELCLLNPRDYHRAVYWLQEGRQDWPGVVRQADTNATVTNDNIEWTRICMEIGLVGTWQGSVKCFDIETDKILHRCTVVQLPWPLDDILIQKLCGSLG